MSSLVSLRDCCCNCHCHEDGGLISDYQKNEDGHHHPKNPYLIGWEEFLNKFAALHEDAKKSADTPPDSPTYSDEEDDILTNEENEYHFLKRMRQRQGHWNGIRGKELIA